MDQFEILQSLCLWKKILKKKFLLLFKKNSPYLLNDWAIGLMVECLSMVWETGVKSQVESYQKLKIMVLDATLLNTQHYKVHIKGKV